MKKSDTIPSCSLSVTPNTVQFVAVDVSKFQTPADSPGCASAGSAPMEFERNDTPVEMTSVLKEKEKTFRWVHVDPTEVFGSLRFRILPVCTHETRNPNDFAYDQERLEPREAAGRAYPVAHEEHPATGKGSKASILHRAPSSEKATDQLFKHRSELYPQYRLLSPRWNPSQDRDSDTSSRGSTEPDPISSPTDYGSRLPDIEPPLPSQSPSPEAEETKFIPRRQTFFEVVLNPA